MASLRWSPDEDTQDAIAALVQSMRDGLPDLLQMAEFIQGCEVYDLDPYGVGLGAFPRFIQVHLRGEYITDVRYRDNLGLAVGDICIVVRFREGEQYEVFSVGGTAGGGGGRWPGEAKDPHGFENRIDSAISFVNGTRTFAITGGAYKFWNQGNEYTGAGDNDVLPAFTDWYFYYYDTHGALDRTTSPVMLFNHTPIAYVFWNNTLSEGILFEERHGISMDWATHRYLHVTIGARVEYGFAITGYTLSPAVPADADNTYGIGNGFLADEDISIWKAALPDNGPYTVWHRTGVAGVWTWSTALVLPFEYTIAGYIEYNQWTGATWQLTQLTAAKYVNYFVFITMSTNADHRHVIIPGQQVWDNLDEASNEAIGSMILGEFPAIESGTLYRVTYRTSNGYGSTGKCRIELVTTLIGCCSVSVTQATGMISHAALPDRDLPNQHPAESISLDTAFNEPGADVDFRVEGTGDINLILVDAGTDRVGIGQVTPEVKLQVNGQMMSWNKANDVGNFLGPNAFAGAFVLGMISPVGAVNGAYVQANGRDWPAANQFGHVYIVSDDRNAHAQAGQIHFYQIGTGSRLMIDKGGNVGIGATSPTGQLHIDQKSTTAAIPVLILDQADVSEEMIEFISTIGVGNALEAKGGKTLTTTHFIKVTLPGALTRYIPCGTIA